MSAGLSIRRDGSVLHLVLDAPERRNALSRPMLHALVDGLRSPEEAVAGVVISGTGSCFSAGADFAELTGTYKDLDYDDEVGRVREAIRTSPRLVVAAIEGPCLGAAADLALACDVRVASTDAYVQVPAVRLGLLYNPEVIHALARSFPLDAVRRLLLLGDRLAATTAAELGLLTEVVAPGASISRAAELVRAIPPDALPAIAATKAVLATAIGELPDSGSWQTLRRELLDSPQRRAAIASAHALHASDLAPSTPSER